MTLKFGSLQWYKASLNKVDLNPNATVVIDLKYAAPGLELMSRSIDGLIAKYRLMLNVRGDPLAQSPKWVEIHEGHLEASRHWREKAMAVKREIRELVKPTGW